MEWLEGIRPETRAASTPTFPPLGIWLSGRRNLPGHHPAIGSGGGGAVNPFEARGRRRSRAGPRLPKAGALGRLGNWRNRASSLIS